MVFLIAGFAKERSNTPLGTPTVKINLSVLKLLKMFWRLSLLLSGLKQIIQQNNTTYLHRCQF